VSGFTRGREGADRGASDLAALAPASLRLSHAFCMMTEECETELVTVGE
jgi:hypothetical protein